MLSTQEAANYWRVKKDKVLSWIHAGDLHAIDVRSSDSSRPQYRIPRESVEEFNVSRCNVARVGERKEKGLSQRARTSSPKTEWFK
jgi:excisionase family DNA binding protein